MYSIEAYTTCTREYSIQFIHFSAEWHKQSHMYMMFILTTKCHMLCYAIDTNELIFTWRKITSTNETYGKVPSPFFHLSLLHCTYNGFPLLSANRSAIFFFFDFVEVVYFAHIQWRIPWCHIYNNFSVVRHNLANLE